MDFFNLNKIYLYINNINYLEYINYLIIKSLLGIGCLLGMLLIIALGIIMLFKQVFATVTRTNHGQ